MEPIPLLDLKAQYASLRGEISRAIGDVVESQSFILGSVVDDFEREAARRVDAAHAVGCASGTDALILSLAALGVGRGDEVVTTPFSFFATASCAYKVGARPVFVDIDASSFNLDPQKLRDAVSPRTKAILPVHLFGLCADMDSILESAHERGIPVVEDAAQAFGATFTSRSFGTIHAGCMGALGCYSFFPSKNLGAFGDGGLVVTQDADLAARVRALRVHGETERYHHRWVGWNSRLDALQAAVLRVKLAHLSAWCDARRANADRYDDLFRQSGVVAAGRVRLPQRSPSGEHIFNQYTIRADARDALAARLRERGIGHAIYYPVPLHLQECFKELGGKAGDFPAAEQAAREVLSLPVYPELPTGSLARVVDEIRAFYASAP